LLVDNLFTGDADEDPDEMGISDAGGQRGDGATGINRAEYSQLIVWEVYG
jgi:hypothetical protein